MQTWVTLYRGCGLTASSLTYYSFISHNGTGFDETEITLIVQQNLNIANAASGRLLHTRGSSWRASNATSEVDTKSRTAPSRTKSVPHQQLCTQVAQTAQTSAVSKLARPAPTARLVFNRATPHLALHLSTHGTLAQFAALESSAARNDVGQVRFSSCYPHHPATPARTGPSHHLWPFAPKASDFGQAQLCRAPGHQRRLGTALHGPGKNGGKVF